MTASRGIYSCGVCHVKGHTRDTCPDARPLGKRPGFVAKNNGYRANREARRCDDCGRYSPKFARCKPCRDRRKRWPSRQQTYRKKNEHRKETK